MFGMMFLFPKHEGGGGQRGSLIPGLTGRHVVGVLLRGTDFSLELRMMLPDRCFNTQWVPGFEGSTRERQAEPPCCFQ